MRKTNEAYEEEVTGIKFNVMFEKNSNLNDENPVNKKVTIQPNSPDGYNQEKGFVFKGSKPEKIKEIATALLAIGQFCEKL